MFGRLMNNIAAVVRHVIARPARTARSLAYHLGLFRLTGRGFDGLHLGCGGSYITGFCNVDASIRSSSDVIGDVSQIKLADDAVGTIYCSHTFEHIPRSVADDVMREWHRVLKPGGTLYLAVPDFEALCRIYLENINRYETQEGRRLVDAARDVSYGGQTNAYDFHYNGFSFTTAKAFLESVGFTNVERWTRDEVAFVPGRHAADAQIQGIPISLNIRATKAGAAGAAPIHAAHTITHAPLKKAA